MGMAKTRRQFSIISILAKLTLLPQFRLALLDRSNNHITHTSIWQSVQTSAESIRFNEIEGFRAAVVSTIQDGTSGETESNSEFVAGCTAAYSNNTLSSKSLIKPFCG
jgi:hypothetical protein